MDLLKDEEKRKILIINFLDSISSYNLICVIHNKSQFGILRTFLLTYIFRFSVSPVGNELLYYS